MSETTEAPAVAEGEVDPNAVVPETPAPAETPAPETEAPADEKTKAERKAWWQDRIDVLTRRAGEAERARTLAEQRYNEIAARHQAQTEAGQQPGQAPGPQSDIESQIETRARQIVEQQQRDAAVTRTLQTGNDTYSAPVFTAACNTLAQLGANERPEFMSSVTDLDNPAAVLHHLGTHPDEAVALLAMAPGRMAMALAKLEARVTAPPPPKPVSRAAPPITPLEANTTVSDGDPADSDLADRDGAAWLKAREKQIAARKAR